MLKNNSSMKYLKYEELLFIHSAIIRATGGLEGIRDIGHEFEASDEEIENFILMVVRERPKINLIAKWLRKNSKKRKN